MAVPVKIRDPDAGYSDAPGTVRADGVELRVGAAVDRACRSRLVRGLRDSREGFRAPSRKPAVMVGGRLMLASS